MKNHIEPKKSELFADLSENEQESVGGGFTLFIEKTDISTSGSNQLDADASAGTLSSNQDSEYTLSHTTIGLNLGFLFLNNSKSRSGGLDLLYRILMSVL